MHRAVIWTCVPSVGSDMDPDNRQYVLQTPLIGIVPILVTYCVAMHHDFPSTPAIVSLLQSMHDLQLQVT